MWCVVCGEHASHSLWQAAAVGFMYHLCMFGCRRMGVARNDADALHQKVQRRRGQSRVQFRFWRSNPGKCVPTCPWIDRTSCSGAATMRPAAQHSTARRTMSTCQRKQARQHSTEKKGAVHGKIQKKKSELDKETKVGRVLTHRWHVLFLAEHLESHTTTHTCR